jgi:hypothetical protein
MSACRTMLGITAALLLLAGCGTDTAGRSDARVIADFDDAAVAECPLLAAVTLPEGEVEAAALSGDTLLAVLYGDLQEVHVQHLGHGGRWSFPVVRHGPDGVLAAAGVAVVRDSFVAIGDRQRMSLRYFDGTGRVVRDVPLGVPPMALAPHPSGVVVAAMGPVQGGGTLLYTVRNDVAEARPVPAVEVGEPAMRIMANLLVMASYPNGDVVTAHRFFHPVGHISRADGGLRTVALPVAPGTLRRAGYIPSPPLTNEVLDRVARVVLDAAVDPRSGHVLMLMPDPDRRASRALVWLDEGLAHVSTRRIDVNAGHMLYAASSRTALVVDSRGRWFACPVS